MIIIISGGGSSSSSGGSSSSNIISIIIVTCYRYWHYYHRRRRPRELGGPKQPLGVTPSEAVSLSLRTTYVYTDTYYIIYVVKGHTDIIVVLVGGLPGAFRELSMDM